MPLLLAVFSLLLLAAPGAGPPPKVRGRTFLPVKHLVRESAPAALPTPLLLKARLLSQFEWVLARQAQRGAFQNALAA